MQSKVLYKRRRICIACAVVLLVLIAIGVGVGLAMSKKGSGGGGVPGNNAQPGSGPISMPTGASSLHPIRNITFDTDSISIVKALAITSGGRKLYASYRCGVTEMNLETGAITRFEAEVGHRNRTFVGSLALSNDESEVVAHCGDGIVREWVVGGGENSSMGLSRSSHALRQHIGCGDGSSIREDSQWFPSRIPSHE